MPRGIRTRNLSRVVIHSRLSSLRLSQLIWGLEPVTLLILVLDRTAEKCWVLFLCNKCRRGKTSAGCSTAEHTINHLNQPHFITSQDSGFHFSFTSVCQLGTTIMLGNADMADCVRQVDKPAWESHAL